MKKSLCSWETTPKLLHLKSTSMIHMALSAARPCAVSMFMSTGTSAVDWWLTMNRQLSLSSSSILSPISITARDSESVSVTAEQTSHRSETLPNAVLWSGSVIAAHASRISHLADHAVQSLLTPRQNDNIHFYSVQKEIAISKP